MPIKLVKVDLKITGAGAGAADQIYTFLAPRGLYKGEITTATDIKEVDPTDPTFNEPVFSIGELIKARKIVRIIVRTSEGTGTTVKKRTMRMFCSIKKIGSVDDVLQGKIVTVDGALVSGSKIISVVGKRDASFY